MLTVGTPYLRLAEGVSSVELFQAERFVQALQDFHAGSTRLIIVFRHVAKEDAPVLVYGMNKVLPKTARRLGMPLRISPHIQFLYGKDVLNWAGRAAEWLFPRIGSIPVVNGGTNKEGLSLIRKEITEGQFPIALAPEGQVTYHMHSCSEITKGTAKFALWGLGSGKDVTILPLALGYSYADDKTGFIADMLMRWEEAAGRELSLQHRDTAALSAHQLHAGLLEATDKTLGLLEQFYRLPGRELQIEATAQQNSSLKSSDSGIPADRLPGIHTEFRKRIDALCERALSSAESIIGIEPHGSWFSRLMKIRFSGVQSIYSDTVDPKKLPPLGCSIADFRAAEAHVYLRHSQIVDALEYLDPGYIDPPFSGSRFFESRGSEYIILLLDIINRLAGGSISTRYSPKNKHACILAGEPFSTRNIISGIRKESKKELMSALNSAIQQSLDTVSEDLEPYLKKSE